MQEEKFYRLYKFLTSTEVLFFRIILLLFLGLATLLFIDELGVLVRLSPFYFFLIIQEIFIRRKVLEMYPGKTIGTAKNIHDAVVYDLRKDFESEKTVQRIMQEIAKTKEGQFFLEKIGENVLIKDVGIPHQALLETARDLVSALHGRYIYPIDVLAAHFVLQEDKTMVLAEHDLHKNDIAMILYWTRSQFHIGEYKPRKLQFHGNGVFDQLVYGWTPATKHYTTDFTAEVLRIGFEPKAIGREKEYKALVSSLSKSASSNVLLVGEEGVGKTTLVMDFTFDSYQGTVNGALQNKRVYFLFVDRLLSGVSNKGEIESRLGAIFAETAHAENVILLIENMENIFGGGGFEFDMSGTLQPYLESNRVQIIATTTPHAYKDFIASKSSSSLFTVIHMEVPESSDAIAMLMEEANVREKQSGAMISYSAIQEVITSAHLYNTELSLPGSASVLLDDVVTRVFSSGKRVISADSVKAVVQDKTGVQLLDPSDEEKEKLLGLEDEVKRSLIGQDEAATAIANAIRRIRSGLAKTSGPAATFLFLGPTGVGKTTTAKLLAKLYFGAVDKLIRVDMSEYQTQDAVDKLLGEAPGEASYASSFLDAIQRNPFSVVLLDEFEKAHPKLLDIFLQILDEGFVTTNKGKKISFHNAIIIATSNAGSEFIRQHASAPIEKNVLVDHIMSSEIFRPELVNRFDDVIVFTPLSQQHVERIVSLLFDDLEKKLSHQFISLQVTPQAMEKISRDSYSAEFGARNVRRYIEDKVENALSRMILEEKIGKGDTVFVDVDAGGEFIFNKTSSESDTII